MYGPKKITIVQKKKNKMLYSIQNGGQNIFLILRNDANLC